MAPKRKASKRKPASSLKSTHKLEVIFTAEDHAGLLAVAGELGVSLERFVRDAINRRLQEVYDFRAIRNRCLHIPVGAGKVCVLCGDAIFD